MSLIDFCCLCMFIVFAQFTESHVLILRDYDDEALVLGHADSADEVKHINHQVISSNYKPKRTHSKRTVLQYGRHIYNLDNFVDLQDLKSKMTQFQPDSISNDYVIDDHCPASDSVKNDVGDYLKDLLINSNRALQFCSGDQCEEDLRKFNKHKNDEDTENMQFGRMKRFNIVDNRHKSKKPQSDSSEEHHEKKKQKTNKKNKKKKRKHSSESTDSKSKESGLAEKIWGSHKKTIKKFKPPKSSQESVEIKRKPKKKNNDDDSVSASVETLENHDKDLKSDEYLQKKNKKNNYGVSDDTKRTFAVKDDFFMQGNKMFHIKEGKTKKKHYDFNKRRRLEDFLPKRYHWDASEIHNLGYYWFNGPKGKYAAPKRLSK